MGKVFSTEVLAYTQAICGRHLIGPSKENGEWAIPERHVTMFSPETIIARYKHDSGDTFEITYSIRTDSSSIDSDECKRVKYSIKEIMTDDATGACTVQVDNTWSASKTLVIDPEKFGNKLTMPRLIKVKLLIDAIAGDRFKSKTCITADPEVIIVPDPD